MHFLTLLSRPGVCLYLYCHRPIDIQLWSQLGPRSNHPGESEKVWLRNMNCFRSKHPVWKLSSDFSRKWLFILSRKKTQETSVIVDVVGQGNPQGLPQGTRTGEYQRHAPRYSTPRVPKDALISDTWKKWKKTRRCCENMFKKKRETLETFKMQIYSYIMLYNSSWMSPLRIILSDRRCYVEIFHDPFRSLKLWGETEFTSGKTEDSVWHSAWSIVDTIYIPLQHIFGNASQHTMEFICIPCGLLERISQKALGYFRPGLSMTSLQRQGCNSTTDMKKWLWMA